MDKAKQPFPDITLPVGYEPTSRENYTYDRFSEWWPKKWKGPAWVCPNGHQMPKEKFDYGFWDGNKYATFCPGCGLWVERKLMQWAPTEKQCTMGYARRKSGLEEEMEAIEEDAGSEQTVQERDEVPARRKNRKRRGAGTAPRECVDSGKNRRRKSKRVVGPGSK